MSYNVMEVPHKEVMKRMRSEHRPMPPDRPRRPPSRLRGFFMGFRVLAVGILLAKYAIIPLLVWVQVLVGGTP